MKTRTTSTILAIAAAALIALSGCSSPETADAAKPATAGDSVSITDGWVKAVDGGMSAAFGTVSNQGESAVTIVSATTTVANDVELHETVANDSGEMTMREKKDGFTIPAGGSLTLEPGGNHIMLMGLSGPIKAGDEITITLTFSDGSTSEFSVPAKDYSGANENYDGDDMNMGMGLGSGGDSA